jgi:hypothetical protein
MISSRKPTISDHDALGSCKYFVLGATGAPFPTGSDSVPTRKPPMLAFRRRYLTYLPSHDLHLTR